MINYLTLTLIKLVACPDILQNTSRNIENDNKQVLDVTKISNLNIYENKRVVRDIQNVLYGTTLNIINYLTLTLIITVACPQDNDN